MRDKLQLRPSTTVPILDHLVWDVVGEGAGVLMRVVRIARELPPQSVCFNSAYFEFHNTHTFPTFNSYKQKRG
jgi:hypothetical protein